MYMCTESFSRLHLTLIFVVNVLPELCFLFFFVFFINLTEGASPLAIPHFLYKFLLFTSFAFETHFSSFLSSLFFRMHDFGVKIL